MTSVLGNAPWQPAQMTPGAGIQEAMRPRSRTIEKQATEQTHLSELCSSQSRACQIRPDDYLCAKPPMVGEKQQCRLTWQLSNECWVRGLQA